ncbi:hypothetical protein MAR_024311 [Mya arenaria]|uniref:DUF4537 domain-containing protein n=1 Tax=Mya arenaria TaxID=6604 RepID=A0ABY7DSR6_MYAAR|nr:uncharacterized protein LOC128226202 [Mya arenaria]WAQ99938.1 hypothetical protein MAR_024311 [Mya arenaria]
MPKRKKGTAGFVHNVEDDLYYPGTIEGTFKSKDNKTSYNVRLDGAGQVRSDNVESSGWAKSRRQLKPGDRVLVDPDEELRNHVEVGSGTHRTSVHVSTEQIIEADQTNATPITPTEATDSQQERPQTKNYKIQTSEPVSGVVIARWREDGWFYFGKVVSSENDEFWIEDGLGRKEQIHKSDIFTETDQRFLNLQPLDKVVAPHPKYIFSYAPAEVTAVYRSKGADLQFFDNTTGSFPWSEMFKISQQKYTDYVHHIKQKG